MGEGGLSGRLVLLIHFHVYLGAWAAGIGISPMGGPFGALSPLITLNWTLSLYLNLFSSSTGWFVAGFVTTFCGSNGLT